MQQNVQTTLGLGLEYLGRVGVSATGFNDGDCDERNAHGEAVSTPWGQWKKEKIASVLGWKETSRNRWDDACHAAGIDTDEVVTGKLAKSRNRATWWVIGIAVASLLVSLTALRFGDTAEWLRSLRG